MKTNEVKDIIIRLMEGDEPDEGLLLKLREAGADYSFSEGFTDRVLASINKTAIVINRESEFLRSFSNVFYRIALTGIAAIIFLLISIYISQGTISFDSFLGLTDANNESIISVLTEN
ncbi:MAG TPA: hypothetical protein P5257_09575 [Bacteroidales bacterium]|nr:hypothetical protein [Bacteroidales bacterium]HRT90353.1 hypothetical protein [Bacteroidales bacterium]